MNMLRLDGETPPVEAGLAKSKTPRSPTRSRARSPGRQTDLRAHYEKVAARALSSIGRDWRLIASLVALALACVLGPLVAPHDPEAMNVLGRFKPPGAEFWLGSDQFGRDTLSRLLVGARATVPLALAATVIGTLIGAVIGTASAYLGGRWDEAIMRTIDAVLANPDDGQPGALRDTLDGKSG